MNCQIRTSLNGSLVFHAIQDSQLELIPCRCGVLFFCFVLLSLLFTVTVIFFLVRPVFIATTTITTSFDKILSSSIITIIRIKIGNQITIFFQSLPLHCFLCSLVNSLFQTKQTKNSKKSKKRSTTTTTIQRRTCIHTNTNTYVHPWVFPKR